MGRLRACPAQSTSFCPCNLCCPWAHPWPPDCSQPSPVLRIPRPGSAAPRIAHRTSHSKDPMPSACSGTLLPSPITQHSSREPPPAHSTVELSPTKGGVEPAPFPPVIPQLLAHYLFVFGASETAPAYPETVCSSTPFHPAFVPVTPLPLVLSRPRLTSRLIPYTLCYAMLIAGHHSVASGAFDHSVLLHSFYVSEGRGHATTYSIVLHEARVPRYAPLTWMEYGKSWVHMKDEPQQRASVRSHHGGRGPQRRWQAEVVRELTRGRRVKK